MYIYKLRWSHHFVYVGAITLAVLWIIFNKSLISMVLLSICILVAIIGLIDDLATSIIYDNGMIRKTGLFKKECIKLNEVEGIMLLPTSKGKKVFVGVYSQDKMISVTFWYKDYKELLKHLIKYCKEKGSVEIDISVIEILH